MESKLSIFEKYQYGEQLGEGTYGVVVKAYNLETKEIVAIKKIKFDQDDEGIPSTTLREISILKSLNHVNIVRLKDIEYSLQKKKLYLVFEFLESDFRAVIDNSVNLNDDSVRLYLYQLLKGLDYCHSRRIIHRDLKPQNLLVSSNGILKIADFGLSRCISHPLRPLTKNIVTLWYRAPELLLGCDKYSTNIDMWSVGCIFAEMLLKKPLFAGDSQYGQLIKIFEVLGTPNLSNWPQFPTFENSKTTFPKFKGYSLDLKFKNIDLDALDLLKNMILLQPGSRISARKALQHPYFKSIIDI